MIKDDKRYREMVVSDGVYVPDAGMEYPQDNPDARLVPAEKVKDTKFDENYAFLDDSFGFRLSRHFVYATVVYGLLFLLNRFKYGLKFEGREILKKYRREFKGGIVSVANHCYKFDGVAVALALRHRLWIPMLPDHINGKDWWLLTRFGGIPLADGSYSAIKKFNDAFDELHRRRNWIHIFSEARNWHYYKPLRPFQKGAFTMAYKWGAPVLPVALTFRPRTGIHKWFAPAEIPLITVKIGEPIFPDTARPRQEEVGRLLNETFDSICSLAGILKNPWPSQCNTKL